MPSALSTCGPKVTEVDNPHANKLMIHILAAVAQHDRCTL
jgi:hypothetical protein